MVSSRAYALARAGLIEALTAYQGITTADGAADGTTMVDSNLIGKNDFITEKTVLIMSGDARFEDKGAASFDNITGAITLQGTGFRSQILKGTIYRVLNISSVEIDVATITNKIGTATDPAGTSTVFAWLTKLFAQGGQGLVYYGKVTQVDDATHFRVAGLVGFGDAYFANNYRIYVVRDAGGAGAAPQGEMQPCSGYDSADGTFTHTAFIAGLAVEDEVLLLHERIAEIADLITRLGDPTGDTLASMTAKWGDIARSLDLILGARWDAAGDLGTDIGTLLSNIGDPSGHILTSLTTKWGDIARSLDLILGARWDAAGDLGTDIAAIITNLGDPSVHTLTSVVAKIGDIARSLDLILGARWDAAGDLGTDIADILADIGNASASTLGSIYAILGNPAQSFLTMIGYEGTTALADKLTAARAGYLDELNTIKGSTGIFHEQADVAVNITAIVASESNVFDLSVADTRYIVRSLRLKCADPGANTVTVRLYELVNDVLTEVDSFAIDASNFATYHSLMDMFGLPHLTGDSLKVTVQASAGGPYAVTGQYSHAKTNV